MLDAAGGGAGGGTPWESYSVERMQQLVKNPDTDRYYELLTGWKRSADLINEHRWQVQNYRDNMAAVWPPERNQAAAAYLTRLDELIANLDETYEAAIANHDAFARATLSIGLAQHDMDEIVREYQANDLAIQQFAAKQQQQEASGTPTPTPSPSGGDQPPVAPGRQEELHRKAAALMHGVSGDLALAQMNVRTPTLYQLKFTDDTKQIGDGSTYTAPPIPPITPNFANSSSGGTSAKKPPAAFPTAPTQPVGGPPIASPVSNSPQPGLVLGGANPTLTPPTSAPAPTTGLPPITQPSIGPTGPLASPGLLPQGTNVAPRPGTPAAIPPSTTVGRGVSGPREGLVRPGGSTPGGLHAMPPGGLIGAVPGGGLGQPGTTRPGTGRVNTIGGVIGATQPSTRAGTQGMPAPGNMGAAPYGQAGGRRPSGNAESHNKQWDPENPWQTAEGVDPVVLPSRERRIDPGPAIGL